MADPFERLAPFLREFLWNAGWESLRPMQVATIEAVFDSEDDLLISAATASGKTEAAFLPILSRIFEGPASSVQALYIGPLKALINDQFGRLEELCRKVEIPVTRWHGDVGDSHKDRVVESPRGVLQITPESIESLLLNRTRFLSDMFSGLDFVVIDEVHTFLDSDRGIQLRYQLERLRRYARRRPRRIGLSATLGDPAQAQRWLNDDPSKVRVLTAPPGAQSVKFALEHFADRAAMVRDLFELTKNRKTLIFCNARAEVEELACALNDRCRAEGLDERYLPHHGSVSKAVREEAEAKMMEADRPSSVVCTSTLELGIDVGRIDLVAQVDATASVASMVQRLGRSGRRAGQSPAMKVYTTERETWEGIPFSLLQAIAVSELWREKWCEPVRPRTRPYHILYQQILSLLAERNGLRAAELYAHFPGIEVEDFERLLRHLAKIDHLQQMENGVLIPGLAGERILRSYEFYSVFASPPDVQVRAGDRVIGSVSTALRPGACFLLGGRVWRVDEVFRDEIRVSPAAAGERPQFGGVGGASVHRTVARKAREILCGDAPIPFASERLSAARTRAREIGIRDRILFEGGVLVPWEGSEVFETLAELFAWAEIGVESSYSPWVLDLKGDVRTAARRILDRPPAEFPVRRWKKFDEHLPDDLLRRRRAADELAFEDALDCLRLLA